MPFHEKSAWIMSLALLVCGAFYYQTVASMSAALGHLAPPILPTLVAYTIALIVIAVIGHILIAILSPDDANDAIDERDKKVINRAGHLSGYVLGAGVFVGLGLYLFTYDGNLMFYVVFGSLMLSQLAEYAVQIAMYRTSVY